MGEEREVHVLSLGAGVQSTVVALMMHRGELRKPDAAIFADPGEEHPDTYRHLAWLIEEVKPSFPVIVTGVGGRLGDHMVGGVPPNHKRCASIPAFVRDREGAVSKIPRKCTKDYKIQPVERAIRRQVLGLEPRQRVPRGVKIVQWFGLSAEEAGRVLRVRAVVKDRGAEPMFPLFDMGMDRAACQRWLADYGVPHEVVRSACVFCPFKANSEWQSLKYENGDAWRRAVEIDRALRTPGNVVNKGIESPLFLHRTCLPIDQIDFADIERTKDRASGQLRMGFAEECEGMCGL